MSQQSKFDRIIASLLGGLLDNMLIGVICLDWHGSIVRANACAREILSHGAGLVSRHGVLGARMPADDRRLRCLLAKVLSRTGHAGTGGSMTVARGGGAGPLTLHLTPADLTETRFGRGLVAALALVVDPLAKPRVDAEQVAAALGLTAAEARVAAALSQGATMREVASVTHRSPSTIHELLKRIHTKLGISRRADLVRAVITVTACQSRRRESEDTEP